MFLSVSVCLSASVIGKIVFFRKQYFGEKKVFFCEKKLLGEIFLDTSVTTVTTVLVGVQQLSRGKIAAASQHLRRTGGRYCRILTDSVSLVHSLRPGLF